MPGYVHPIQQITSEEYKKASSDKIKENENKIETKEDIFSLILNYAGYVAEVNEIDSKYLKAIGSGKLRSYRKSSYGNYIGFQKDDFIYAGFQGAYFKIKLSCKNKVAESLIEFANHIKNGFEKEYS